MNDQKNLKVPAVVKEILSDTAAIDFQMASEPLTGLLLRTLAASKPNGNFLELGTGTGVSTAWLLDGMDRNSRLTSVKNDRTVASIAQKYLWQDPRVIFHLGDAEAFIESLDDNQEFDLIFADTWAGKFIYLEKVLSNMKPGGIYIIDDMLPPQANWQEGHELKVTSLITQLDDRRDLTITKLNWASGIIMATKL